MPMQSWGQGSDPSSTFAYLAAGNEDSYRVMADRLDARREAEQQGHDQEVFDRYQAGKVSDDDWLAYIDRRISETGYDPEQQANWRKARLDWAERISDDRAQADFDRTGDYGAYIDHLREKLSRTKDSSGRLEIMGQIRQYQDARDQRDLQRGAQRITDQISAGKATDADLLRFYRQQRQGLRSNSPLADTIAHSIRETQARIEQQRFESGMARVQYDLSTGALTPVEAGKRMQSLIKGSTLLQTDPTTYYSQLDAAAKLIHSPDPAQLAKLSYQLQTGQMTPGEYEAAMYRIADRVADYDPQTAFELRSQAYSTSQQATGSRTLAELSDPGRMQVGPGGVSFRWISQMDGSQYAATNCTMASGAMLAYAMGYKGLSGGDLRYLTGDQDGGTNVTQLYNALNRAGVDTSGMDLTYGGTFDKFKRQIANGRSSVIVGSNANIPASAKASASMMGLHSWLVADYDPKRDAFLVYNSAMSRGDKRSKDGYWVSSDVMQAFAFGQGTSHSWLAAPPGTAGKQRNAWHVIDVDTPPQRKGTPKSYVGRDNRGISGSQRGATRATGQERPVTDDQYKALMDRRQAQIDQTNELVDAYGRGETSWDGTPLDESIMDAVDSDLLDQYDEAIAFADDNDDYSKRASLRGDRSQFVAGVRERNGARTEELFGTLMRDLSGIFEVSQFSDPQERAAKVAAGNAAMQAFAAANSKHKGDDLSGSDLDGAIADIADAWGVAADPDADLETKRRAIGEMADRANQAGLDIKLGSDFTGDGGKSKGNAAGNAIANAAGWTEDKRRLDNDEGVKVAIPYLDPATGTRTSRIEVVPVTGETRQRTLPDGTVVEQPVPDLSGFPDVDPTDLSWVLVQGRNGPEPMQVATFKEDGWAFVRALADDPMGRFRKGDVLDQRTLDQLSPRERQVLSDRGILSTERMSQTKMVVPGRLNPDGSYQPGAVMVRDDGLGGDDLGTGLWYPERLPVDGVGGAIANLTDVVGVDKDGHVELTFGGYNGYEIPLAPGVDPDAAQRLMDSGQLEPFRRDPAERRWRDTAGNTTADQTYDDSSTTYWTPQRRLIGNAEAAWQAWKQDRAQQAVQQAQGAAQAAEQAQVAAGRAQYESDRTAAWGVDPTAPKGFDPSAILGGAAAKQAMDLAAQFGVRTPQANPNVITNTLRNGAPPPADPGGRAKSPPPPVATNAASLPNPRRTEQVVSDRTLRQLDQKPQKRWVPPSPPVVTAARAAQANQAAARAKAAAAAAAAAARKPVTSGGIFGPRAV